MDYSNILIILLLIGVVNIIYVYVDLKKTKKKLYVDEIIDDKINITISDIKVMNGREFELFCADLFKQLGYKKVDITQATNDEGKDLILDKDTYVECKCWNEDNSNVGREVLQKLVGAIIAESSITRGICITTTYFNKNAKEYMKKVNKNSSIKLELYDIYDIEQLLKSLEYENTKELNKMYL